MIAALFVSQLLLWALLIILALAVFALARQVGVLHERIAPLGALASASGLRRGDAAPAVDGADLQGARVNWTWPQQQGRSALLLFVAADCPLCKEILPVARRLVADERNVDLYLIGDGEASAYLALLSTFGRKEERFCLSSQAALHYRVGKLPHAVLIDGRGAYVAGGLCNTREHLESLLNAYELGVDSIQEYIAKEQAVAAAGSRQT